MSMDEDGWTDRDKQDLVWREDEREVTRREVVFEDGWGGSGGLGLVMRCSDAESPIVNLVALSLEGERHTKRRSFGRLVRPLSRERKV